MAKFAILLVATWVSGCADRGSIPAAPEGAWSPTSGIATRVVVTCDTDGSVGLSAETVQPRPDGVHLEVHNAWDEPVSVGGFDAGPGVTDWVLTYGPGMTDVTCWPYSQHGSAEEPERYPLEIVDPQGLYVDGELPCEAGMSTTVEWAELPVEEGPPPMPVARDAIEGLRPDDVLRVAGYPDQESGAVVVVRGGEIAGRYGFSRFRGEPWTITSGSACEGTGLPHEGESYG